MLLYRPCGTNLVFITRYLITVLQPQGLPPLPVFHAQPQSPLLLSGTKPIEPKRPQYYHPPHPKFVPTTVPGISCGERTQSIIATPGIETAPFVHVQRLQMFPASADVQLWWPRSARRYTLLLRSSMKRVIRIESAALTPQITTLSIPLLVHPIGYPRYALVLQHPQFMTHQ